VISTDRVRVAKKIASIKPEGRIKNVKSQIEMDGRCRE
jgi:hypothetical protein